MKSTIENKIRKNINTLIICFIFTVLIVALCAFIPSVKRDNISDACSLKGEILIQSERGRVIGNGRESLIELYATYRDNELYASKINLKIKDIESGKTLASINPIQDSGIQPSFILADFKGAGTRQIFLAINSGGSGGFGYYYVYDISDGKVKTIFDYSEIKNPYKAEFQNNYKLNITNLNNGRNFYADISKLRDKSYLEQLYNSDGTLKVPQEAVVWDVGNVFPYYNASMLKWQLETFNQVSGLYHADGYGNMINLLDYTENGFRSYYEMFALI